ncbi:MAG: hypothetical protein JSV78_12870 [Phycisphaerales bacterium]|nr:MAG: hypothetical protein JSV78_12870 [Phycisphaerales bacterium]
MEEQEREETLFAPHLFLPIVLVLAVGVVLVIVAIVPKHKPDQAAYAGSNSAGTPVGSNRGISPAPPVKSKHPQAIDVLPEAQSPSEPAPTPASAETVAPGLSPSSEEKRSQSPGPGGPPQQKPEPPPLEQPAEAESQKPQEEPPRWRHGPITLRTSLFGYEDRGVTGQLRRRGRIAPVGKRYLFISMDLLWAGPDSNTILITPEEEALSTVQLRSPPGASKAGPKTFDPLGVVVRPPNPLLPFSLEPIDARAGGETKLRLAFLVPERLESVTLLIEAQEREEIKLPPAERVALDRLVGFWTQSQEALSKLRYADPLLDALAREEVRLLHLRRGPTGAVELSIQSAGITSAPLVVLPDGRAAGFSLQRGQHLLPAKLRITDAGSTIVLTVGQNDEASFVFDRMR